MKSKTINMCDGWKIRFKLTQKDTVLTIEKGKNDSIISDSIQIFDSCKHKPLTELKKFMKD